MQSDFGVQDIVVTAQRKSENLQRVPIAISAVTADQLTRTGVTGLAALQTAVPSLSVQNVAGYLATHLRGVGSIANGPGFENPIALYVDGVYYANQSFGLAGFNNIERIEVLKGPQGTLFGRNATGGLLQILTKDPGRTFQTNGSIDYGNYQRIEGKFYAGGPVSDDLSADLAVRYAKQADGWGKNFYNGSDAFKVYDDVAVRSKVIWKPGAFKFTLIGDYNYRRDSLNALRTTPGTFIAPGVPAPVYPNRWDIDSNVNQFVKTRGGGVSLKGQTDLGFATVSDQIAWRETRFNSVFDFDGSPLPLTAVSITQKDRQFSNEFQLTSNSTGRFSWVGGVYYFSARGSALPISVMLPPIDVLINGNQGTQALSGYAQGTYKLTDKLSFTGGVRYSWEKRTLDARSDGLLPLPGGPIISVIPEQHKTRSFRQPTFRAALDYRLTNDILVYASVNTGFKSGGFNVTIASDPAYLPEKLTSYEIGEKADLFGRRARLNTALFYYDYRNFQVQIPEPVGTGFTNAAKSKIYGADIDLTVFPIEHLEIVGSTTLLSSRFDNFPNAPVSSPNAGTPVIPNQSVVGNRLPYTPRLVYNLSATYTVPMGSNELAINGGWLHSASFFFEPDNVVKEGRYDQFNASVTYRIDHGRFYVTAYGNNLTNKLVRSLVLSTPSGPRIDVLQAPRTYGARVGFNF